MNQQPLHHLQARIKLHHLHEEARLHGLVQLSRQQRTSQRFPRPAAPVGIASLGTGLLRFILHALHLSPIQHR